MTHEAGIQNYYFFPAVDTEQDEQLKRELCHGEHGEPDAPRAGRLLGIRRISCFGGSPTYQ